MSVRSKCNDESKADALRRKKAMTPIQKMQLTERISKTARYMQEIGRKMREAQAKAEAKAEAEPADREGLDKP